MTRTGTVGELSGTKDKGCGRLGRGNTSDIDHTIEQHDKRIFKLKKVTWRTLIHDLASFKTTPAALAST